MGGIWQTLSLEPFGLRMGILKASKNDLKISLITDAYLFFCVLSKYAFVYPTDMLSALYTWILKNMMPFETLFHK